MNRRTSLLLWLVIAGVTGVMLVQVFIVRAELLHATADEAGEKRDLGRIQAKLATASRSAARLEERLREQTANPSMNLDLTPDEQIIESLRRKLAEVNARHAGEVRPPPLTNPFGPNYAAENMADPAYAVLYRTMYRMRIESEYNELFASGFVPPETMKRLADLLMERGLARMDTIALTGASRWGPGNPPTKEQLAEDSRIEQATSARFEEEIHALQPLTPVQRTQLQSFLDGLKLDPGGWLVGFSTDIDEAFAAKAAGVLTPGQMDRLRELQAEQRSLQER